MPMPFLYIGFLCKHTDSTAGKKKRVNGWMNLLEAGEICENYLCGILKAMRKKRISPKRPTKGPQSKASKCKSIGNSWNYVIQQPCHSATVSFNSRVIQPSTIRVHVNHMDIPMISVRVKLTQGCGEGEVDPPYALA